MEFVAAHTRIPVPRVHDVFVIDRQTSIVVDYTNAAKLTHVWGKLTPTQQEGIFTQLRKLIAQRRSLESPHADRLQAVDGNGLFDSRLCLDGRPFDPFATVGEFHTCLSHLRPRDVPTALAMVKSGTERSPSLTRIFLQGTFSSAVVIFGLLLIGNVQDGTLEYWEYTSWADSNYRSPQIWLDKRDEILDMYAPELLVEIVACEMLLNHDRRFCPRWLMQT